jgi:hydrogenase maturation protein HypF
MTSGNYSDEPIVKDNDEALERLAPLADAFLLHNRDIHVHCDDSVMRLFEGHELPVRRSRGYAPFPVRLPFPAPPLLAVGGELKSTFCLTKDNYAFMSQHIGDMENLETLQAFAKAVAHFKALFRVEPEGIAGDMHPRYLSSRWAQVQAQDLAFVPVQHHHAHIAAVMAENGLKEEEPVIGFSFDGTGYGLDGAIWGGEVLLATYRDFRRAAHLKYIPLPGGDAAVKRPYRIALAHLWAAGESWHEILPSVRAATSVEQKVIKRQLETGFNTVPTSSMGRLFDAVASLAGVRQTVTYEAQAAIELEALIAADIQEGYCFDLPAGDPVEIDPAPVIRAVAADVRAGVVAPIISARFHHAVADLVLCLSLRLREKEGLGRVALSGGVFQNVTLLELTAERLRRANFEVLIHRLVPPNDGGLALGQAVVGAMKINQ